MEYNFKIGDIVITSDGRKGVIESICNCKYCQERGFLEPLVKPLVGRDIYITIYDKERNFDVFYQIGEYTFGNIDPLYTIGSLKSQLESARMALKDMEKAIGQFEVLVKLLKE